MYRIIRYFVWYILSLTMKACAMDTTQANTISPIIIIIFFSFPYINVVFSYLCSSLHLALCLATAYFMKFTLLLTSTASTTAKQQAATTNTIIIIVILSFLSNLIFSSPYWSSFFDCTAKVVPFVFAHKQKNNYFSFVITFIDIRQ